MEYCCCVWARAPSCYLDLLDKLKNGHAGLLVFHLLPLSLDQKNHFFKGWSRFKFSSLELALGMALKFNTSVAKGLKLKVKTFWGLICMFVEVTGE